MVAHCQRHCTAGVRSGQRDRNFVALWMLFTGKVQEFAVGDVKIVTAIREASVSPIKNHVAPLPVADVHIDPKAGVEQIPALLRKKTEALGFRLGGGGYYGPAIAEYLARLSQSPSFRYVVITTSGRWTFKHCP